MIQPALEPRQGSTLTLVGLGNLRIKLQISHVSQDYTDLISSNVFARPSLSWSFFLVVNYMKTAF